MVWMRRTEALKYVVSPEEMKAMEKALDKARKEIYRDHFSCRL